MVAAMLSVIGACIFDFQHGVRCEMLCDVHHVSFILRAI